MKKKTIIFLVIILLISMCLGGIGFVLFLQRQDDKYIKTANEDDISRYEWMEMLCEQNGLTEYQNEESYYEDVDTGNSYFSYIQSAVEWDVLESEKKFDGDDYASGRFVLITAMKSLGERKLKLYLDTEKSITDAVYIQTALEHSLLEKEELSQGISRESAERVLEQIAALKYTEFWVDDYERVEYQDGVVELISEDILDKKENGSEITVSESVLSNISVGTIVVYPPDNSGMKAAKRVSNVDERGKLTLVDDVEQDEVIESFIVSDIVEVTAQDIFNYYGLQEEYSADNMAYNQIFPETMLPVWGKSGEWEDKGFKIAVSVEEGEKGKKNYLEIEITDNNTGDSMILPIKQEVSWVSGCQAELDVNKIYAAGQVEIGLFGIEYAEMALDIQSTFKGGIKTEKSKESARLKLFETPAPLGSGIAGVDIQVYLVASVEGEMYLEVELPANFCVKYDKKSGIRNEKVPQSTKKPELKLNCEVDFMLRIEPILLCLLGNVMDIEADIGIAVEAEVNKRPIDMVCIDLSAAFPIFTISVSADDNIKTLIGDTLGISAEWKIFSANKEENGALFQTPFQLELHFERLPDKTEQYVEECTYSELVENDKVTETAESQQGNTYITQNGDIRFAFDYPDSWTVNIEEMESMSPGFKEVVVLKNNRDITLMYREQLDNYRLGGHGIGLVIVEVTEIADSAIADFMVAKIKVIGNVDWETGEEYAIEDGLEMYAVIPKDYTGTHYYAGAYYADYLSFLYHSSTYYLSVVHPDGKFTEEEEKEVINILQSFREVP